MQLEQEEFPRLHVHENVENDAENKESEQDDRRWESGPEFALTTQWDQAGDVVKP